MAIRFYSSKTIIVGMLLFSVCVEAELNEELCTCQNEVDDELGPACSRIHCLYNPEIFQLNNSTWSPKKYNMFRNLTLDEALRSRLGTVEPRKWITTINPSLQELYYDKPPREFDPRLNGMRNISSIRNSNLCGESWAVSTVDVIADRFSVKFRSNVTFSVQEIIDCKKNISRCQEGNPVDAWDYAFANRLSREECYSQTQQDNKCNKTASRCQMHQDSFNVSYKINYLVHLSSHEVDIMHEIERRGSVQATMRIYQDFFFYGSGIYKHWRNNSSRLIGFHSVRIIGWGESSENEKYWIVANSMGTEWGENGYFRIVKGTNECEIESNILAAKILSVDAFQITPPTLDKDTSNNSEYCSTRFSYKRCCDGLENNCSVPFGKKLCYCSELCSKNSSDHYECCPDYESHCQRVNSLQNISNDICQDKNKCHIQKPENIAILQLNSQKSKNNTEIFQKPKWSKNLQKIIQIRWLVKQEPQLLFSERKKESDHTYDLPAAYQIPEKFLPQPAGTFPGNSWAVSAVGVVSNRLSMKYLSSAPILVSVEQLLHCSLPRNGKLHSGQPENAWIYMSKNKMVKEGCFSIAGTCKRHLKNDYVTKNRQPGCHRLAEFTIGLPYRITGEAEIMEEIFTSGSVQATMRVYPDYFENQDSIYQHSKVAAPLGYISVQIIGWGEDTNTKFWIVPNPIGETWHSNGTFRIMRGVNECEIESHVIGVQVQ